MIFYKQVSRPKVLSFDLDNTIYDCETVLRKAEAWFAKYLYERYQLANPKFAEYDFWAQIKNQCLANNQALANDVTALRAYSLVDAFKLLGKNISKQEAFSLVAEFVKVRSKGSVSDKMKQYLRALKQHYEICAISNGNVDTRILGVDDIFGIDFRPKVDIYNCKPHADLFIQCAQHYSVDKKEILHIGDDPYTDVMGAVYAGCQCAWVYRGYTGISPDEHHLKVLPSVSVNDVYELSPWLMPGY